jgi:hydroxymethylglutaryl-CoA reductase (NADPH)
MMAIPLNRANDHLKKLLNERTIVEVNEALRPKFDKAAGGIPRGMGISPKTVNKRWEVFTEADQAREQLLDSKTVKEMKAYQRNIENFIGTVKVPVGIAGPLRVNGLFAQGDYYVPLATTEAALVASYSRGAQLITKAGGATALLLSEGVSRAPGFAFDDLRQAGLFVSWIVPQLEKLKSIAAATTRYGELIDLQITLEGNHVYLRFDYTTGDAAGQNMVTIATQAICDYIEENSPVQPRFFFVEANLSGDKKASAQSFMSVRGKKVTAEVILPKQLVESTLYTTPQRMVEFWTMSAMGGVLSGTIGVQGHYANGLAAMYIACGQDAACVSESAVGVTRFELTSDEDLYCSVILPNLIVGTVGGGTGLPSQQACLDLLGLAGSGGAQAFAEVAAVLSLAGEVSIIGAMCAGHFSRAHQRLAREQAVE